MVCQRPGLDTRPHRLDGGGSQRAPGRQLGQGVVAHHQHLAGRATFSGQDLFTLDEDRRAAWRAERVGFVFQSFQLLAQMTALENVMLPLELAGRRDADERARRLLERVGLGARLNHYPRTPTRDADMLREAGCHLMFIPEVAEMYPNGAQIATRVIVPAV